LGLDVKKIDDTIFDALVNEDLKLIDVIRKTSLKNLDIAPSNKFLTDFVINVASHEDRHLKLTKKIDQLNGYDYLLIDCPPSLGLLTVNILLAVTEVIIPVSLTFLALDGCAEIVDTVRTIKRNFAKNDLDITMVVPTFYRNTNMANAILEKLRTYFGNRVSDTIIKFDVKIDQSQSFGKTIYEFAPDSTGAKMMGELAKEVMAIGEGRLKPN
ncbi:MAG: ParA family protein, partial [Nitrospinae bacterium]|nr:ParA family protein [Nitrospinota bacterium]